MERNHICKPSIERKTRGEFLVRNKIIIDIYSYIRASTSFQLSRK
jgi:hypothetical protein